MSLVNQEQSKRLLSVHGWSGTELGAVLYVVILTGTIVVFASEIGRWSAGGAPTVSAFDRPVDATLRALAADVDPTHMDEMFLYAESSVNLIVNIHAHRADEETGAIVEEGTIFTLDPKDFSVIDRYDGVLADSPVKEDNAFGDFLVSVHVNLYAPFPYGLYATGLLGFVMLIAVISGIILHKHIIKDLFVRPRWSSLLLNRRDRHILAGSWSLPFGFLLAFTGTFYSFATSIGLPVVAMTAFGGDQEAVIEAIVASPMEPDETPMPMADIDAMIALSTENARGVLPLSMSVSHWGRADAYVSFFHEADAASLTGAPHALKGATGEYLGPRPLIGSEPSAASSVAGLNLFSGSICVNQKNHPDCWHMKTLSPKPSSNLFGVLNGVVSLSRGASSGQSDETKEVEFLPKENFLNTSTMCLIEVFQNLQDI